MITTKLNYADLLWQAKKKEVSILRYLFDAHVYKHVTKRKYETSCRRQDNIVQIIDHGSDHVELIIKVKGADES